MSGLFRTASIWRSQCRIPQTLSRFRHCDRPCSSPSVDERVEDEVPEEVVDESLSMAGGAVPLDVEVLVDAARVERVAAHRDHDRGRVDFGADSAAEGRVERGERRRRGKVRVCIERSGCGNFGGGGKSSVLALVHARRHPAASKAVRSPRVAVSKMSRWT